MALPSDADSTPTTVAAFLRANAPDELMRARAVHDYVATHVDYDVVSFSDPSQRAPQDVDTVFQRKIAVCEGYARLFDAIAKEAGLESEFIPGDARGADNEVDGRGHAWNAVRAKGQWYLLDATWDAGFVNGSTFTKKYTSEYLFAPPAVFGVDHFPEAEKWQLRTPVITRGDFMRTPQMRPSFFANGSVLESPDRSQITVSGSADVDVLLPQDRSMFLAAAWEDGVSQMRCDVMRGRAAHVHCVLPHAGTYRVLLFESPKEFASYDFVGEIAALDTR
jgi:transglutaminase/protease-like cytokinesis protein 3